MSTTPAVNPKGNPRANMGANNVTGKHTSVHAKTGNTHSSQFGKSTSLTGHTPMGKQNMPAKNSPTKMPAMGTTHHAVGGVPAYLKRSK